jgi:ABC-type multidrug transport system fused ATPase/permease subunit
LVISSRRIQQVKESVDMKSILLRNKKAFAKYLFACTVFVTDFLLFNYVLARITGVVETRDLRELIFYLLIGLVVLIYSAGIFIFSRFLRIGFMRDTILYIREKAFEGILSRSYRSFDRKRKSEYVSNLVNDINTFENQYFYSLLNVIHSLVIYSFSLTILIIMEPLMALMMFVLSMLVFLINHQFQNRTIKLQQNVQQANEQFTVQVSNTFSGLEILKLNRIEDKFLESQMVQINGLEQRRFRFFAFTFWQGRFSEFLGIIILVGIIFYITGLFDRGYSIARVMFMIQLSNALIWPISLVIPLYNTVKSNRVIIENILKKPPEDRSTKGTVPFAINQSIEISDLTFGFQDRTIFSQAAFTLEKGKKYLVRGPSGSGKSTLFNLLSKVYDDYEGSIRIDGTELRDFDEKTFNENSAWIYQDIFLFQDTLRNNITLYRSYSKEQIETAIKAAGLSDFVQSLPKGLEEKIEENGKNLSGGQRQRISIARAIIRSPDLLFSDEMTSALDEALGKQIEKTLLELDTTVIAISHRFYPEVSRHYDAVIELGGETVKVRPMAEYLREEGI